MGRFYIFIFAILILTSSYTVAEAQEPITASANATLLPEMPRRLLFTVEANSNAGEITEARLFFQPIGSSARISEPVLLEQPAATVSLEHEWQMQLNRIPPGAKIEYFWRLTDSAGNEFSMPAQHVVALDPRFEWQTVEDEELAISWYDGDSAWGDAMFTTGKEALAQLEEELGSQLTRQVRLVAYGQSAHFRDAFPIQQDWIGGQAFTDLGVTVQIIGAGEQAWMRTVLFHELSHLVFHQATEGSLARIPSWVEEGLAMYNEPNDLDSGSRDSAERVLQAAEDNELLAFSQLQGNFGTDGETVGLAYAQSEMLVTEIIDDCGNDGFRLFVQNLVDDMSVDNALENACGYDSNTLYNRWRQTLPNAPVPSAEGVQGTEENNQPEEPNNPTTSAPNQNDALTEWIPLLVVMGLCFVSLLGIAILYIITRLLRPQGVAK